MTAFGGYYDASYPPELWETPAAPVGVARSGAAESPAVTLEVAAGEPGAPGAVVTADGVEHVGILPTSAALLTVAAGAPGTYAPELKAAERPANITELRERATPAAAEPWEPGQYVLVGERGKRAHWDGQDWRQGEAPERTTVPVGTVERSEADSSPRSDA